MFNLILGIIIGLIIGGGAVYFIKPKIEMVGSEPAIRKQENLAKIKALLEKSSQITNDQVQEILKISDATAERYLDELEKDGLIRQVGKTGVSTYYKKV